ncbi:PREDICTED: transcription factor mef2A [Rhagoletis zephyria]|uniref:transcription factor mef2A n=1 Tax=Rhagoletis zephyria TaxID=28612 RepID=UPI00081177FB|nr:PREDICTED: transcription factor mef2A [Rhagoletis zephyria]
MAAATRNNPNEENGESGGSGTRANTSSNNNNNNNSSCNNNNNDDSTSRNQPVMDEMEMKLKRQTLEQRKQDLERVLSEKNWLLQQIQKQETQIFNGNYEYLNVNDIFAMLARQYKKEFGGIGAGDVGSTAVLRRKTISGTCKDNPANHNNTSNNNNRQSEISNRSSEYDNYPAGDSSISDTNTASLNVGAAQQQLTKSQSMKKRSTTTPTTTSVGNYNYLQAQQRQQQLLQQQMLQNHMQYSALIQHQHYHHQQHQMLQYHQGHEEQQQPQQQQYKQQISPSQSQSRHYPADTISLYSVNSASVATLRQQHIAPQQQAIVVQCDRYYLSPTHQSYNDGGFIKSSQNIKKYVSPQASPTHHGVIQHSQHPYQQDLQVTTAAAAEQKYQHHQQQPQQQQKCIPLQQLQSHILLHQPQHASSRQLDAISLAPSYISVDVESAATHNPRWRSQSNLPPISPHTPPHRGLAYNQSQIAADTKSHSSDMLSSNAYYNTSAALPAASIKSLTKPLDEISISSLNSETQKTKPPKPKQWMESSLDGPVMRQAPAAGGNSAHLQDIFHNTTSSPRMPTNKSQTGAATLSGGGGGSGPSVPRERGKLSSQSMSCAPRHYSMSAASHKNPYSQTKMLQDDDGRYAKLSQSTSYLNSRESPSISAAYPLDGSTNSTTIELPTPTTIFKYLPPKPSTAVNAARQLTPPPPPRPPPIAEKAMGVGGGVIVTNAGVVSSALSPTDIRIESPKNITVVKPATFRPYQEETKPFEMSDFYKYSTKFRQKEPSAPNLEH